MHPTQSEDKKLKIIHHNASEETICMKTFVEVPLSKMLLHVRKVAF